MNPSTLSLQDETPNSMALIKQDWRLLATVPVDTLDETAALMVVAQCGLALALLPTRLRTRSVCEAALQPTRNIPLFLRFSADEVEAMEAAEDEVPVDCDPINVWPHIPAELIDESLSLRAVAEQAAMWELIPAAYRTKANLTHAALQDTEVFSYADESLLCEEILVTSLRQSRHACLAHIPIRHRSFSVCLAAVEKSGSGWRDVPPALQTEALCTEAAMRHLPDAAMFMADRLLTLQRCVALASGSRHRPQDVLDRVQALASVHMREPGIEEDTRLSALILWPEMLADIPWPERSKTLCQCSLFSWNRALIHTPQYWLNGAVCAQVVSQFPEALQFVPAHLRSECIQLVAGSTRQ